MANTTGKDMLITTARHVLCVNVHQGALCQCAARSVGAPAHASRSQRRHRYSLVMIAVVLIIHAGYDLAHLIDVTDLGNI